MSFEELDNLVKTGLLKSEPGDQREFAGLLDSGHKRLVDAKRPGLSPESQFDLAYGAAHAFALAARRVYAMCGALFICRKSETSDLRGDALAWLPAGKQTLRCLSDAGADAGNKAGSLAHPRQVPRSAQFP
jgi:hypothetical protein